MQVEIAKIDWSIEVDWEKLPEASRNGIIEYGLRQILNDAHAAIKEDKPEEVKGLVQKRLDALLEGTYRFGAGGGKKLSEVELEIRRIVALNLQKKGKGVAEAEKLAKEWKKVVAEAQHEALMAKAEANVKLRSLELEITV